MSLTPLHFIHRSTGPWYGISAYVTDCGRFQIGEHSRYEEYDKQPQWRISAGFRGGLKWMDWLQKQGLGNERFPTRRSAIHALKTMLIEHRLTDADEPS